MRGDAEVPEAARGSTSLESTPATESSSPAETDKQRRERPAATSAAEDDARPPAQGDRGQQQDRGVALAGDEQLRCVKRDSAPSTNGTKLNPPSSARTITVVRRAARPSGFV